MIWYVIAFFAGSMIGIPIGVWGGLHYIMNNPDEFRKKLEDTYAEG